MAKSDEKKPRGAAKKPTGGVMQQIHDKAEAIGTLLGQALRHNLVPERVEAAQQHAAAIVELTKAPAEAAPKEPE
jgi:hypothetical protein